MRYEQAPVVKLGNYSKNVHLKEDTVDIPNDSDVEVGCQRVLGVREEAGHDGGSMEPLERVLLSFLGGFGGPLLLIIFLLGCLRSGDEESTEPRQFPKLQDL